MSDADLDALIDGLVNDPSHPVIDAGRAFQRFSPLGPHSAEDEKLKKVSGPVCAACKLIVIGRVLYINDQRFHSQCVGK
jgi:hypothetical protein